MNFYHYSLIVFSILGTLLNIIKLYKQTNEAIPNKDIVIHTLSIITIGVLVPFLIYLSSK